MTNTLFWADMSGIPQGAVETSQAQTHTHTKTKWPLRSAPCVLFMPGHRHRLPLALGQPSDWGVVVVVDAAAVPTDQRTEAADVHTMFVCSRSSSEPRPLRQVVKLACGSVIPTGNRIYIN